MKIQLLQSELQSALDKAEKLLSKKATTKVLDSVKITATKKNITLTAHNFRSTLLINLYGEVLEEGSILIEKSNFRLIKRLSGNLTIKDDENRVLIEGNRNLKFTQDNVTAYPEIKNDTSTPAFTVKESEFKTSLKIKVFTKKDEVRPVLNACCINGNRILACDGFRIAKVELNINNKCNADMNIPFDSIDEIDKILDKKSNQNLEFIYGTKVSGKTNEMHQLSIKGEDFEYITRLVPGEFFEVDKMFSEDYSARIEIPKTVLLDSLSFAKDITAGQTLPIIKFGLTDDQVTVSAINEDKAFSEVLNAYVGYNNLEDAFTIRFNNNYLTEIIKVITDDTIRINFGSRNVNPVTIEGIETDNETYLLCPFNINR